MNPIVQLLLQVARCRMQHTAMLVGQSVSRSLKALAHEHAMCGKSWPLTQNNQCFATRRKEFGYDAKHVSSQKMQLMFQTRNIKHQLVAVLRLCKLCLQTISVSSLVSAIVSTQCPDVYITSWKLSTPWTGMVTGANA